MRNKIVPLRLKPITGIPFFLLAFLAAILHLNGADFKGATVVLREASETDSSPKVKELDPNEPLRNKLKAFQAQSTNLPPTEAVTQWLAFVDEFEKSTTESGSRRRGGFRSTLQFDEILTALPAPAAWIELEKAVEARSPRQARDEQKRELGLRIIVHTLTGNSARRTEDLKALDVMAKSASSESAYEFMSIFQILNESILATMDDPEAILRMLESQLNDSEESPRELRVPNLVGLVGPEKAEGFFRKAFKTSGSIELEPGTPTHNLATKIALEMVDQMPKPQWALVNSLDSVDLFEAMDKKFNRTKKEEAEPAPDTGFFGVNRPRGFQQGDAQARLYYFLGLIARNRVDDAIKVAKNFDRENAVYFPPEIIKQMERAGLAQQLHNFFTSLLKEHPESVFWNEYVQVAAHAGHSAEALNLIRTTLDRKDLGRSRQAELKSLLPSALLANDEIEAGIAELRQNVTNRIEPSREAYYSYRTSEFGSPALLIARIGKLLDRKDWLEEGIRSAKQQLDGSAEAEQSYWNNPELQLAQFLSESGRGPEAEEILLKALRKATTKNKSRSNSVEAYYMQEGRGSGTILAALLKVYYQAGRFDDVIVLLDQAEDWGAKDLLNLDRNNMSTDDLEAYSGGRHLIHTPIAFYAASALAKVQRRKEASVILDPLLEKQPGLDRLYELLLELDPTNPVPRLDELFARDQFEERPLIWKAHWLRTNNKLEEAEAAARKAISIDPSDGEEGPDDRMRAYAELAEIREARGDLKEAEFFRGAVAAIRESEMADRLHAIGLLKRAVKMYRDSLTHFADAYCIQSRLAIQLADLGLHEEAEEHYRKAYELMPESFGRVESHCFGCERAFEGERAQGIAEKVFTTLAQKTPNKPQVHYLLGYLREEQDRPKEALDHYRAAVRLDPDYLNAWNKILENSSKTVIPANERDQVVFNLLRLDPKHRHAGYGFGSVSDLAALWDRVAAANISGAKSPAKMLYPLTASKRKMEQNATDQQKELEDMRERAFPYRQSENPFTPASAVSQNGFIRAGATLIGNMRMIID